MNFLDSLGNSPLVHRTAWALLHSLWQLTAVALCLALVLPVVRRRGAHASYVAGCAALFAAIALPVITATMLTDVTSFSSQPVATTDVSFVAPSISAPAMPAGRGDKVTSVPMPAAPPSIQRSSPN